MLRGDRREFWRDVLDTAEKCSNQNIVDGSGAETPICSSYLTEKAKIQRLYVDGQTKWSDLLPQEFLRRHRQIFGQLAFADYGERTRKITRDVTRTFSIFAQQRCPSVSSPSSSAEKPLPTREQEEVTALQHRLFNVLNAVAEAEDGYCQGMNFVAAVLLVDGLSDPEAYSVFIYALRFRHLSKLFKNEDSFLNDYIEKFARFLEKDLPKLHNHLAKQKFLPIYYGIEWFTTLFSNCAQVDLCLAVYDLFLAGVKNILFRVGIAIFRALKDQLLTMNGEELLKDFKPLVKTVDTKVILISALAMVSVPGEEGGTEGGVDTLRLMSEQHEQVILERRPPDYTSLHRSLSPYLSDCVRSADTAALKKMWAGIAVTQDKETQAIIAEEILHHAIYNSKIKVAEFALDVARADPNAADEYRMTPLHFAAVWNRPNVARLLLTSNADPRQLGGVEGVTPLALAETWAYNDTSAVQKVLKGAVCLHCNAPFELLKGKKKCAECNFTLCESNGKSCFADHRCKGRSKQKRALSSGLSSGSISSQDTRTDVLRSHSSQDEIITSPKNQSAAKSSSIDAEGGVESKSLLALSIEETQSSGPETDRQPRKEEARKSLPHLDITSSSSALSSRSHDAASGNQAETITAHGEHKYPESQNAHGRHVEENSHSQWRRNSSWTDGGTHHIPSDSEIYDWLWVVYCNSKSGGEANYPEPLLRVRQEDANAAEGTWYCSDPACHTVFGLFKKKVYCCSCEQMFCDQHAPNNAKTIKDKSIYMRVCIACQRLLKPAIERLLISGLDDNGWILLSPRNLSAANAPLSPTGASATPTNQKSLGARAQALLSPKFSASQIASPTQ